MPRIFSVTEEKLAPVLDTILKSGGLAVHKVVQDLLASLQDITPVEVATDKPASAANPSDSTPK